MDKIDSLILDIKKELYDDPIIKEYLSLKEAIDNNEELKQLSKEMKAHQKAMCENMDNDEIYFKEKETYESYLNKINFHPLMQNYNAIKDEVFALLSEVKDAIK